MARPGSSDADLLIVGSEPAASVAAIRARSDGLTVRLVRSAGDAAPAACAWLTEPGCALLRDCGLDVANVGAARFAGLTLHSGDLRRRVHVGADDLCGWIVERGLLDAALRARAADAGCRTVEGAIDRVELRDEDVRLTLRDGTVCAAAILIIADGADSPTAAHARIARGSGALRPPVCISASFEAPPAPPALSVVLGPGHAGNLATIASNGARTQAELLIRSGAAPQTEFERFCAVAAGERVIPAGARPSPRVAMSPAGLALEFDSHVGKRTLLAGEAGGFVAAFSNDRLYPALRSAWIAAEIAGRAVASPLPQDVLVDFEQAWRTELADYLRMPNTDLSLLLPLVFNEKLQMSRRVARAFLFGEKF